MAEILRMALANATNAPNLRQIFRRFSSRKPERLNVLARLFSMVRYVVKRNFETRPDRTSRPERGLNSNRSPLPLRGLRVTFSPPPHGGLNESQRLSSDSVATESPPTTWQGNRI